MDKIRWARYLGQIECEVFSARVYCPLLILCWLFPGYWRYRLPHRDFWRVYWVMRKYNLAFAIKGILWAFYNSFRQPSGFLTEDVIITNDIEAIAISGNTGKTWGMYETQN